MRWPLDQVLHTDDGIALAQALQDGTAIAVSDGSYKDNYGTAAWTLQGSDEEGAIEGVNIAPGHPKDQSSYRSEIAGLYGIIAAIKCVCTYHQVTQGSIEVGCDGEQALYNVFDPDRYVTVKNPDYDLIISCRRLLATVPINWKYRHIDGHQDNHMAYDDLDRWAQLNVDMDINAKTPFSPNRAKLDISVFFILSAS